MRSKQLVLSSVTLVLPLVAQGPPEPDVTPPQGQIVVPGLEKLTIGGQYRLRYENRHNYDLDRNAGANEDFFGQRVRLDFDAELRGGFGVFVQLQDVRDWGEETSTVDDSADGLDVHQAFVRIDETPWIGGEARVGRQILSYGAQRLIGGLDWLNQGRSFDGVKNRRSFGESGTIDAFAMQLRERAGNGDDDDAWLFGGYATHEQDARTIDAYVLAVHDDGTGLGTSENRVTIGGRLSFDTGPVGWETEIATQVGEVSGADIPIGKTLGVHVHGTLALEEESGSYLRADFDYGSGDDPDTADQERFDNLFPTGHAHWGIMDVALWSNLVHGAAEVGTRLGDSTRVRAAWHMFYADEADDLFTGPVVQLSAKGVGTSREMGNEIDLVLVHDLGIENIKASLEVGYGVFLPGAGAEQGLGGDDLAHFVYVQADFDF